MMRACHLFRLTVEIDIVLETKCQATINLRVATVELNLEYHWRSAVTFEINSTDVRAF